MDCRNSKQGQFSCERGATMVEYGIMVVLIVVVVIVAVQALGRNVSVGFSRTASAT